MERGEESNNRQRKEGKMKYVDIKEAVKEEQSEEKDKDG